VSSGPRSAGLIPVEWRRSRRRLRRPPQDRVRHVAPALYPPRL